MRTTQQHCLTEWSLPSRGAPGDGLDRVEVDVVVTDPAGRQRRVPAFWAGGSTWRVRYAPLQTGRHRWHSECLAAGLEDLHGQRGAFDVEPYTGDNPLLRHGPLRVAASRRTLEHADGTPFLWLGDTWWLGLCQRLTWPGEFMGLVDDRAAKGFTVIQVVAGLYPDMPAFDARGDNEAGGPWEADYASLRPAYFDHADRRLAAIVAAGMVPCIVGAWGFHLGWLGVERMQRHWRCLVARYGAWPVVWCLAGEGTMPYYLSTTPDADRAAQRRGWTEVARAVRRLDPIGHPLTIHPCEASRLSLDDSSLLDLDMLQTGHQDRLSLPNTLRALAAARASTPTLPVIEAEVCYEGIGEACRQELQRLLFWAAMLSGAAGFTYGANGLWQVNRREKPFGPSPHGMSWGDTPWDEAARLPGSAQVGLAARLLAGLPWWRFEPHPEWVEPHATPQEPLLPMAGGVPGLVRVLYLPCRWALPTLRALEPGLPYRARLVSPVDGRAHDLGVVQGDDAGTAALPVSRLPVFQDWVLILERA
ncbi:MAG: DUF4038 domain-containing protein [Lentisphaerae bacterium]|nr:DUF4038 domain-containing protein [Lentisphaerota bacterium]